MGMWPSEPRVGGRDFIRRGDLAIIETHFQRLARWLAMESQAETARVAERRKQAAAGAAEQSGETLLDLVIVDSEPGLGGRIHLKLVKRHRQVVMPWNRLRVGSPVVLSPYDGGDPTQGVVSGRNTTSIEVAVDEWPEGDRFRVDLSPDEITRKRQLAALRVAEQARGRVGELRRIFLGELEPRFLPPRPESIAPLPSTLNPSQEAAVQFALAARDLAIIHGPPGTGKTTTVVELICRSVARGEKVLACAPSNTAVDNLLEKLVRAGQRVVRIGHPARVDARLREFTLDSLAAQREEMQLVLALHREAEQLMRKAARFTRARPAPGQRQEQRREARELRAEARLLEDQAVSAVLEHADIICATTTFNDDLLEDRRFDLVVIDEACQSTEPGCWVPALRAERMVLAGDHCQLPPTVLSTEAAREGFETSLLERMVQLHGDRVTRQLNVQYRMHQQIMDFSSRQFYRGSLEAHESVAQHLLRDLPTWNSVTVGDEPLSFIDTAGAGWEEEQEPEGSSRWNPREAELVLKKVAELEAAGLATRDIAVIAPYAAQVRWLRDRAKRDALEIDTVDGFQGREKEAVLISCVRSNSAGEIGFLADTRRMNVALTRARRKLILIGDSATLGGHPFYAALLEYFESQGAYHSVWEELSLLD
jgi:ATP-dependent RNA/DNA helicase IGHMBP2